MKHTNAPEAFHDWPVGSWGPTILSAPGSVPESRCRRTACHLPGIHHAHGRCPCRDSTTFSLLRCQPEATLSRLQLQHFFRLYWQHITVNSRHMRKITKQPLPPSKAPLPLVHDAGQYPFPLSCLSSIPHVNRVRRFSGSMAQHSVWVYGKVSRGDDRNTQGLLAVAIRRERWVGEKLADLSSPCEAVVERFGWAFFDDIIARVAVSSG